MTSANDRQVGGEHYKATYQHWDFVTDAQLSYLEGCATKYLARWRKKNGTQDLEKALHYVDKMLEIVKDEQLNMNSTTHRGRLTARFCEEGGVDPRDTMALSLVCTWSTRSHLELARQAIEQMLAAAIVAQTPIPGYAQDGCCGGANEEPEQTYVRSLKAEQLRVDTALSAEYLRVGRLLPGASVGIEINLPIGAKAELSQVGDVAYLTIS